MAEAFDLDRLRRQSLETRLPVKLSWLRNSAEAWLLERDAVGGEVTGRLPA